MNMNIEKTEYITLPFIKETQSDENWNVMDDIYYHGYMADKMKSFPYFQRTKVKKFTIDEILEGILYFPDFENKVEEIFFRYENHSTKDLSEEVKKINAGIDNINRRSQLFSQHKSKEAVTTKAYSTLHLIDRNLQVPKTQSVNLFVYDCEVEMVSIRSVIDILYTTKDWLYDLIEFFDIITDLNLQLREDVSINDFLFTVEGNVKLFISQGKLIESTHTKQYLLYENLVQFGMLLNDIYIQTDAGIFNKNNSFRIIFSRIYNGNEKAYHIIYNDFNDIKNDLIEGFISENRKRVGVFLDTANFLRDLGNHKLNFNLLINKLFKNRFDYKIVKRQAIIYRPLFEDSSMQNYSDKKIEENKEYLENNGFKINIVENGKNKAKEFIDNNEFDIDDQTLIKMIRSAVSDFDELIIISGDSHFIPIYKEVTKLDKEVFFISSMSESTSKKILESGNVLLIDDYIDCFIEN